MKLCVAFGMAAVMASSMVFAEETTPLKSVVKSVEQKMTSAVTEKKGEATVKLQHVKAVHQNGSAYAEKDKACEQELSSGSTKYVGLEVTTTYTINPDTMMMSAVSEIKSPTPEKVNLNALGIDGGYSFGNFSATRYVTFNISKTFTDPASSILVINSGKDYNCAVLSNHNALSESTIKAVETLKSAM